MASLMVNVAIVLILPRFAGASSLINLLHVAETVLLRETRLYSKTENEL